MDSRFDLDRVLAPDFQMVHGPELEQVRILSITLIPATYEEMLSLEFLANVPMSTSALHKRIAQRMPMAYVHVHRLCMEFRFCSGFGEPEERIVGCLLTAPDQHNLPDGPTTELIWQLFLRWGLYV